MSREYSTAEVAKALGIHKRTLLRWLYADEIAEPARKFRVAGIEYRVWTQEELDRVKDHKERTYRKRS